MTCCWRPIPVSDSSSWMSSSRHVTPLSWYSESPSRKRVRVIVTSVKSIGNRWAVLSIVSDTSDRPSADRSGVPAKMTSSMRPPRTVRGPCAPRTQATASTRFDLPEPFGPTTTVTPGSNSSTVLSANDLKPRRVNDLRNTRPALFRQYVDRTVPSDRTHEDRAHQGRSGRDSRPIARESPAPQPAFRRSPRRGRREPGAAPAGTTRARRRRRPEDPRAPPRPGRRRGCAPTPRPRSPAPGPGTTPGTTLLARAPRRRHGAGSGQGHRSRPGPPRQTWHASQKNVERPPMRWRTISLRHRRHDSPSRAYTLWCSWYSPGLPLRSTYCSSASEEPRYFTASWSVSTMARYRRRISSDESESLMRSQRRPAPKRISSL